MIKSCSSGCYDSTHKRLQNKRTTRCYGKLYRLCYATRYVEKAELLSHQLAPRIAAVMPRNTLKAKRGPGNTVHYAVDSIHIIQNKSTFYIIIYALHLRKRCLCKENKKWVLSSWVSSSCAHSHLDMEWRARDVVITPLNVEDVLAPVRQLVGNPVLALALVFHVDLVAGGLRTVDSDKENVVASTVAVHNEGVLLPDHWSRETRTGTSDGRGVRDEMRLDCDRPAVRARV